jgi:methyl halide transferase
MNHLDEAYWQNRYDENRTGWDIGTPSPALTAYAGQLSSKDTAILIPGCGNAHEAAWLLRHDFTNITLLDIAEAPVKKLQQQFAGEKKVRVLQEDFFEHRGAYDVILEQTFFCALHPTLRNAYVQKMHGLLLPQGELAGLLFNRSFEGGPPFGGSEEEYRQLLAPLFNIHTMASCYNSIEPRRETELFFIAQPRQPAVT